MKWDCGRTAARNETRLLALEERSSVIHRQKRERTGEDLAGDDDALDYSDTDHLTQSEIEWLEAQQHARARRGL